MRVLGNPEIEDERLEQWEKRQQELEVLRQNEVVVNGEKMCPGGCDGSVDGCIIHAGGC